VRQLKSRERQIGIGKARPEYRFVCEHYPEYKIFCEQYNRDCDRRPRTPDPKNQVSKRQFDSILSEWRRGLHTLEDSICPWLHQWGGTSASTASHSSMPSFVSTPTADTCKAQFGSASTDVPSSPENQSPAKAPKSRQMLHLDHHLPTDVPSSAEDESPAQAQENRQMLHLDQHLYGPCLPMRSMFPSVAGQMPAEIQQLQWEVEEKKKVVEQKTKELFEAQQMFASRLAEIQMNQMNAQQLAASYAMMSGQMQVPQVHAATALAQNCAARPQCVAGMPCGPTSAAAVRPIPDSWNQGSGFHHEAEESLDQRSHAATCGAEDQAPEEECCTPRTPKKPADEGVVCATPSPPNSFKQMPPTSIPNTDPGWDSEPQRYYGDSPDHHEVPHTPAHSKESGIELFSPMRVPVGGYTPQQQQWVGAICLTPQHQVQQPQTLLMQMTPVQNYSPAGSFYMAAPQVQAVLGQPQAMQMQMPMTAQSQDNTPIATLSPQASFLPCYGRPSCHIVTPTPPQVPDFPFTSNGQGNVTASSGMTPCRPKPGLPVARPLDYQEIHVSSSTTKG